MGVNYDLAYTVFSAIEDANILPVAWPNVLYGSGLPYYQVWIMPTSSVSKGIGDAPIELSGLIHVNVVIDTNIGMLDAVGYAEQILGIFPDNSTICGGSIQIILPGIGHVGSYFQQDAFMAVPVDIPYKVLT